MTAEKGNMKIYMHTDLEGVSGIGEAMPGGSSVVETGHPQYPQAVKLLLGDIQAAIEGARAGGATEITVLDSHGGGGNFTAADLKGAAEFDPKENGRWWGKLDESYDATFFIGAHAMAGTLNGFYDHTQCSGEYFDYKINGKRFGEVEQWAMVAAEFGVPLVMVAGDAAVCAEAKSFFDPLETAVVKRGRGWMHADCLPLDAARANIRKAAKKAMSLIGKAKPMKVRKPVTFTLVCCRSDIADKLTRGDIERVDARTVRWVRENGFGFFPWEAPLSRKQAGIRARP